MLRRIIVTFFLAGLPIAGWAHDPGLSTMEIRLRVEETEVSLSLAPIDARALLPEISAETEPNAAGRCNPLPLFRVSSFVVIYPEGHEPLAPNLASWEAVSRDNVTLRILYPTVGAVRAVRIEDRTFGRLGPGHRTFAALIDAGDARLVEKLLSPSAAELAVDLPTAASSRALDQSDHTKGSQPRSNAVQEFFRLGVMHILTGYDHLLFLFGLLVVCVRIRSIVAIISCFTVAHSLTLALAAFNLVNFSPRVVEPLIAATIIFVGVENLVRKGAEPQGRWILTFVFGLVHGFGFASVLRELGIGSTWRELAAPLFSFNLGVEAGQLSVALTILPLLLWFRGRREYVRFGVPALSSIVVAMGLIWLLERTIA